MSYKQVIRDFYKAIDDGTFVPFVHEHFAADYRFFGPGEDAPIGREQLKQFLGVFRSAFSFSHTLNHVIEENGLLVSHWTVNGTHTGEFANVAPTGRTIKYSGIIIQQFNDQGRIVTGWTAFDSNAILNQITPQTAKV